MRQLSLFDFPVDAENITSDDIYEFRQRLILGHPVHPVGKFNGVQMRRFKEAMNENRINDARALVMEAKFDG